MQPFNAKVQGRIVQVVDITPDGQAVLAQGEPVPAGSVLYPQWDPTLGLLLTGAKKTASGDEYEVYTATRGRRLAHVVPVGSGRGMCGTTVDPLWLETPVERSRVFSATKALALATCERCKAVLRGQAEPTVWHAASDGRILASRGRWAMEVVGSTWFAQGEPGVVHSGQAETIEAAQVEAETFVNAILLDEPEPALPEALGGDDEEDIEDKENDPRLNPPHERDEITQASRKTALKDFAPHEQDELIAEGGEDGRRARNLDRLLLEGTHYDEEVGLW